MPCSVESASLDPRTGSKFVTGGEDLWVHVFDFFTGEEIGKFICFFTLVHNHSWVLEHIGPFMCSTSTVIV
jgi:hypothetical protein